MLNYNQSHTVISWKKHLLILPASCNVWTMYCNLCQVWNSV